MRNQKGQAGENREQYTVRLKGGSRSRGFKYGGRKGMTSPGQWLILAFGAGALVAGWLWADRHASERNPVSVMEERAATVADGSKAANEETDRGGKRANSSDQTEASADGKSDVKAGETAAGKRNDKASGTSKGPMKGILSAADAAQGLQAERKDSSLIVRIYLADDKRVERAGLETYVKGVVAAEMPTDFAPAALEAQAIAARTYLIRRLWNEDRSGVPVRGADVTDTVTHQVYRSKAEMDALREADPKAWAAVDEAVRRTRGIIMVFGGAPIESLYFASSNGYTENAKDVFDADLPYLVSVDSPWDREDAPAPRKP